MANTQKTKQQIMAERAAAAKRMPEPLKPKVRKTQAQIDAELAAAKKAAEKYRATRPSKEKRSEMINAQQSRMGRSKTVAPKPTVKPKPLTGPAAVAEIQRRTSPAGVKRAEMDAKKATNKKYPGLYKK